MSARAPNSECVTDRWGGGGLIIETEILRSLIPSNALRSVCVCVCVWGVMRRKVDWTLTCGLSGLRSTATESGNFGKAIRIFSRVFFDPPERPRGPFLSFGFLSSFFFFVRSLFSFTYLSRSRRPWLTTLIKNAAFFCDVAEWARHVPLQEVLWRFCPSLAPPPHTFFFVFRRFLEGSRIFK